MVFHAENHTNTERMLASWIRMPANERITAMVRLLGLDVESPEANPKSIIQKSNLNRVVGSPR
jgi:hypothetical protein